MKYEYLTSDKALEKFHFHIIEDTTQMKQSCSNSGMRDQSSGNN